MIIKGQLHAHTTFSDGNLTPQQVADAYESMGFSFLAITDHDHLLKPSYFFALKEIKTPLLILAGIELTVHCSKGYVHVSRIDGNDDSLYIFNHPADYDLGYKRTIPCIAEVASRYPLDAIEVTNHGFYTPQFDTEEIAYRKVAADDSHDRLGCGRGWIEMDCKRNTDTIIAAIKRGDFVNRFAGRENKDEQTARLQGLRFA